MKGEVSNSDSLRVNGAGDSSGLPRGRHHLDLTPHRVLCVSKLPENFHDAINQRSPEVSVGKGNERSIAVLVSGDVKPGGWASRA